MRGKGERKHNSIRGQLIWTFTVLLVLAMLLFGLVASFLFERTLTSNTGEYVSQMVGQLNDISNNYISYMEDIASVVLRQEYVRSFAAAPVTKEMESRISEFLRSILDVRSDMVSIVLLLDDGRFITDNIKDQLNDASFYQNEEWYLSPGEEIYHHHVSSSHVQNIIKGEYPWVITVSKPIMLNGHKRGVLIVDLNFNVIKELGSSLQIGNRGYVFIINQNGRIVYHPRQDLIYNNLKHEKIDEILTSPQGRLLAEVDGEEVLYIFVKSGTTGWTTVGVANADELFKSKEELQFYLWLMVVGTFLVVTYLSFLTSARITKPIEILRQSMQRVEQGDFDIEISVDCDHEVYDLAMDCQIAIRKIRELLIQSRKDQEMQREKELMVLQSQINPHFLYNTLDSIIWLTEAGKKEDAVQMTEQLASFFRLSLSRGEEIITVRRVMEHLDCYLTIQKMRYKYTLDYRIMVDPVLYEYYTLKLLLQPLVENSIYHGLKTQSGIGHILISGDRVGNFIHFRVKDDGIGVNKERLELLRRGEIPASSRSGVGIGNVLERARLFWGDQAEMTFESEEGKGMEVCLIVPLIKENPLSGNPINQ